MQAPDDSHRLLILGRTGSGKTQAAAWHLARRSFDRMPWIIFDFKRDKLLNSVGAREIELAKKPPSKPGLYILHPLPGDDEKVTAYLWKMWQQEKVGAYFDEGYMMGTNHDAFRALLTQGRSKRIPMIVLSQRPSWMDRFAISEADFYQIFSMNDYRDRQTVQQFVSHDLEIKQPKFHSVWADVGADQTCVLKPVPDADTIRAMFRKRIRAKVGTL